MFFSSSSQTPNETFIAEHLQSSADAAVFFPLFFFFFLILKDSTKA